MTEIQPPPPRPVLLLRGKPMPMLGLILTSLLGLLASVLALALLFMAVMGLFRDLSWRFIVGLIPFMLFAAFLGLLFGSNAISYWREFFQRRHLYLAITGTEFIYQHYNLITDRLERLVIPRKDIIRLGTVNYPGGPESPSVDNVQVWYRKPDGDTAVVEISAWYGGVNLYRELKAILNV